MQVWRKRPDNEIQRLTLVTLVHCLSRVSVPPSYHIYYFVAYIWRYEWDMSSFRARTVIEKNKPRGYWNNLENVRITLEEIAKKLGIFI